MRPVEVNRYIALILNEQPSEDLAKEWYRHVKKSAPYGSIGSVAVESNEGVQSAAMVKRTTDEGVMLLIPIIRDLTEDEVARLVSSFSAQHDGLDFDVEATTVRTGEQGAKIPKINVAKERYMELCRDLAKKQHEDWVQSRMDDGWRYGPDVSIASKTHPLLRTWDQLPDRYRTVDFEHPQRVIDLLDQHGYTIVSRDDLTALFRAARSFTQPDE